MIPPLSVDHIRIVGIDPGTDTLGIGIVDVHCDTLEPRLVYGRTFTGHHGAARFEHQYPNLPRRDTRVGILLREVERVFIDACPNVIAAESPFMRKFQLSAYESLTEFHKSLRGVVWRYSPVLRLHRFDPVSVKNNVGVSHVKTTKDDVARAVIGLYKDRCAPSVEIRSFDEHTYDAIAVCHAALRTLILKDPVESTRKRKGKRGKKLDRKPVYMAKVGV